MTKEFPVKFRVGQSHPELPGLVYLRIKRGKAVWGTQEQLLLMRKRSKLWQRLHQAELSKRSKDYRADYKKRDYVKCRERDRRYRKPEVIARQEARKSWLEKVRSPEHQEELRRKACDYSKEYARLNPDKSKEWKRKNAQRVRALERKRYHEKMQDPQWRAHRLTRHKTWMKKREVHLREYRQKRRQQTQFKLADNIRRRINWFLRHRGSTKSASTEQLLGCSFETLRLHLEAQFKEGMTWENFGVNGWHVDHKLPISMFDVTSEKMQKIAFNFQNLQPLWRKDNLTKSDKIEGELFRGRDLRKIVQFRAA